MKIFILTLLLVISLVVPAWARLGETEDQLIARYGKETGRGGAQWNKAVSDSIQFRKGGYLIVVWLFNGVSAEETIAKAGYNTEGKQDPLTADEITTLVNANAEGQAWKQSTAVKWVRDDGAIASVSSGNMTFDVKSKALMVADAAAINTPPPPASLQGF